MLLSLSQSDPVGLHGQEYGEKGDVDDESERPLSESVNSSET
jgi:hypothetical protein